MNATIKLYDSHPYEIEFEATILSAAPVKKGWEVVLDQTLFFPEEGGQSADTGRVADWDVTDVQIRGEVIYHMISAPNNIDAIREPEVGMKVSGRIDWERRFSNMQNHTGEHILSGLIHTKYGFDNVGFHLSDNIVTFDQSGYLTAEQVKEIEQEANRIVWANLPVTAKYLSPEDAKNKTYRSKIEIDGDVRLVTIGEEKDPVDVCACCAPHVARTGEIGLIKILRSEKYKGGTRLTILCGSRALAEISGQQEQIEKISHLLRAKQEDAFVAVAHLFEENAAQKERLIRMQEEKIRRLTEQIDLLRAGQVDLLRADEANALATKWMDDGIALTEKNSWVFVESLDPLPHRNLVNLLGERCDGYVGAFLQTGDSEYRFIIGSKSKDCREVAALLRERFGAKGGGKSEMVQGSVCAGKEDIVSALLAEILSGGD